MTIKCCFDKVDHYNKYSVGGGVYLQCSRVATRDGFCFQHHPEAVAKREEERTQRILRRNRRDAFIAARRAAERAAKWSRA